MNSLSHIRVFKLLLTGFFIILITSNISAQSKRDLTKDSPFLPPGYRQHLEKKTKKPPPPPKAPPKLRQNLELRGYFRLGGVWRFSVFDKRTNKSQWIILNDRDRNDGIYITEFDYENGSVQIEQDGHKESISISSPSGNSLPIAHLKAAAIRKPATKPATPTPKKPTTAKPPVVRQRIVTPR